MSYVILFAAPVGTSKSPTAHYLSCEFSLPIFNNDTIRTEVKEDTLNYILDNELYKQRRDERLAKLLKSGHNFIFDASIDRSWAELKPKVIERDYKYFIISYDLSKELITKLYKAKGYEESLARLNIIYQDHQNFLSEYVNEVSISIKDENFNNRLKLITARVKEFVDISSSTNSTIL